MRKLLLLSGATAFLLGAALLTSCEGPAGPAGVAGKDGKDGTDGKMLMKPVKNVIILKLLI